MDFTDQNKNNEMFLSEKDRGMELTHTESYILKTFIC